MAQDSFADQTSVGRSDLQHLDTPWLATFAIWGAVFTGGWALLTWIVWVLQGPSGSELVLGAILTALGALALGSAVLGFALRRQDGGVSLWSTSALTLAACLALALAAVWVPA